LTQQPPDVKSDPEEKTLQGIFDLTTKRPIAILMVVVAVVVFGLVSYNRLSLNLMPDISYPSLTIRTEYPGAAPEEIENLVSRPIEEAVGVINNLVSINSISKSEISDVILEFTWDTDMNVATQDIREKLDPIFFPDGVENPMILRYDPSLDPVMRLGVYGIDDLYLLRKICDEEIKRELEGIPGVAAIKVKGGLEEEIRVEINERQIASLGLDIGRVNTRLAQENINLAGGKLKEGEAEYLVRTFNEFRSLDEIGNVLIGELNGVDLRVKDIGSILRDHTEREVITRVNGRESVEIEIHKEADANAVSVAKRVKEAVFGTQSQREYVERMEKGEFDEPEEKEKEDHAEGGNGEDAKERLKRIKQEKAYASALKSEMMNFVSYSLPEGVHIVTLSDQSVFIENSVKEVRNTALIGGILAVIVLFLFLRKFSTTLIVGVSIPISIIATFACMHISGVSLNIMSLGGLALGVGMLVDNSIVVIESIFRCREEGDGIIRSAHRGVREVSGAVTASTLTTIAVFFPIVFVEGVAGQIFGDMSLTVVFALLTSLAVSLFVIPMMASRKISKYKDKGLAKTLRESDFLQFKSLVPLKSLSSENEFKDQERVPVSGKEKPGAGKLMRLFVSFILEAFSKVLFLLWIIVELTIKSIVSLLFPLLLATVMLIQVRKEKRWANKLSGWLGVDRGIILPRTAGGVSVWEGIFLVKPESAFRDGISRMWGWIYGHVIRSESSFPVKMVKGLVLLLPFLLGFFYILARFYFHQLFSITGKIANLILHLAVVLITVVSVILGAVLKPFLSLLTKMFDLGYSRISEVYPPLLKRAVQNPGIVVFTAGIPFLLSFFLLLPKVGRELIPEVHQGEFNVEASMPVGTPLVRTLNQVEPIEELIQLQDGVDKVATVVGAEKKSNPSAEEGEHSAKITVKLESNGNLIEQEEEVVQYLRRRLAMIPDMDVKISRPTLFSFKTPVEVEIKGYDLETLGRVSREIMFAMREIPGLSDVKANIQKGYPEVQIHYDRNQLARHGLSVYDVASLVRNKVQGYVPTEFREQDRRIDIRVRLREGDKKGVEDLRRLIVNPGGEIPIPLSAVADIRVQEGPSEIRRIDQQRAALITANLDGLDLGGATRAIYGIFDNISLPAEFSYRISGQNREMETSMKSLLFAMTLAIFLVYVVMASQFESLIHPFVIIFTVPLALFGVILALYAAGISISVMVFIGFIMLVGIVVNNAIVLIDYINTLRRRGMEKAEAILLAGKVRLRPILMTTMTTVLGLLPMALGIGEGAEIRTPMAVTVIAGLISATLLTLIVIPTIYSLVTRGD
jgi:multidrug efflux pump subunit AcrB